jgi:acyl carrier protein
MGQVTAKTTLEVMWWIETTPHHKIDSLVERGFIVLFGHGRDKLRVPVDVWKHCFVKSSNEFDNRMYRWDHKKHRDHINEPKVKAKEQESPISSQVISRSEASIEDRVTKILVEHLGIEPNQVVPSANIIEDLGADSLDTVELVMALEEEFNIEVFDDAAETMQTVKDVLEFLKKHER